MDRIKLIALLGGTGLILFGYRLLAVPVELPTEKVILLAESGMLAVIAGGIVLIAGILRKP